MRKLRDQELSDNQLNIVFDAIILSVVSHMERVASLVFLSTELVKKVSNSLINLTVISLKQRIKA